jgi:hypothetical protein
MGAAPNCEKPARLIVAAEAEPLRAGLTSVRIANARLTKHAKVFLIERYMSMPPI